MTQDEARDLLKRHISSGWVDPRTLEHSCREVVVRLSEHPDEREVMRSALVEVIAGYEWQSATVEQFENAAYLAVNLSSGDAIQHLVSRALALDDPSGRYATLAVAAIRSAPADYPRDAFLPVLFRLLKSTRVAHLAFEALCEMHAEDSGAYLLLLSHYHRANLEMIQRGITHVYYKGGDTNAGAAALKSAVESADLLRTAVAANPFIPSAGKECPDPTADAIGEVLKTKTVRSSIVVLSGSKGQRERMSKRRKGLSALGDPHLKADGSDIVAEMAEQLKRKPVKAGKEDEPVSAKKQRKS